MSAERKIEDLFPRAPRYEIEAGDDPVLRFAHKPKGSKPMHTRIVNLSESGMAFLVPFNSAPAEEQEIKLEFNAPNCPSIACFAIVRRVQIHRTYNGRREPQMFKLVAVEFKNLHPKQRQILSQGLTEQFRNKQIEYERNQRWLKLEWTLRHWGHKITRVFQAPFQAVAKLFKKKKSKELTTTQYTDL